MGGSWTAESVGKVIWIVSILSSNGSGTLIPESAPESTNQISKFKNEKESDVMPENMKKKRPDKNDDEVIREVGSKEDIQQTKVTSKRKRK